MEIDSYVAPDNLSYLCLSCHRHEHTGTKEPMTSVFVLRTERQMKEKLEQLARADGKDTSSYVRMIFEQYLSSRGSKAK